MTVSARLAAPMFAVVALAAAAPSPAPLIARVQTEARAVEAAPTPFERTTRVDRDGKATVRVDRYTPGATPAWTLVSVDGRAPTADESKDHVRAAERQAAPGYGRLSVTLSEEASLRQEGGRPVIEVPRIPAAALPKRLAGSAKHVRATAYVADAGGRPYVDRMRFWAPEPFRVFVVAKVEKFDAETRYARGDDGTPRLVSQRIVTHVNLFGRTRRILTEATFKPV